MNDEIHLREKAQTEIRAGRLPHRCPDRTWGGPGAGVACAVCGALVTHEEVELEIEFIRGNDNSDTDKYHVHVGCFTVWQSERENLERSDAEPSSNHMTRSANPGPLATEGPQ